MDIIKKWQLLNQTVIPDYHPYYQVLIVDGASLAAGASITSESNFINRQGVKMISGLEDNLGNELDVTGPKNNTYGPSIGSGVVPAHSDTTIPVAFTVAAALDKWRQEFDLELFPLLVGFNGDDVSMSAFDDTQLRGNSQRWMSETIDMVGGPVPILYSVLHGDNDIGETSLWYEQNLNSLIMAVKNEWSDNTGFTPEIGIFQTGGLPNTSGTNTPYGPCLAQMEVNGLFLGPLYPYLWNDGYSYEDQLIFSEIAGYVKAYKEKHDVDISLKPSVVDFVGNSCNITYNTQPGKSLIFESGIYDAHGGLVNHGVEVFGADLVSVTLVGSQLRILADGPISAVQIAMQNDDFGLYGSTNNYSAHRCDILESSPEDSLFVPGRKLKRFIPSGRFENGPVTAFTITENSTISNGSSYGTTTGDEIVITRTKWNDEYGSERVYYNGVDIRNDIVDNLDGTYSYTASVAGTLEYYAFHLYGTPQEDYSSKIVADFEEVVQSYAPIYYDFRYPESFYTDSSLVERVNSYENLGYEANHGLIRQSTVDGDGAVIVEHDLEEIGIATTKTSGDGFTMANLMIPVSGYHLFFVLYNTSDTENKYLGSRSNSSSYMISQTTNRFEFRIAANWFYFDYPVNQNWNVVEMVFYPAGSPKGGTYGSIAAQFENNPEFIQEFTTSITALDWLYLLAHDSGGTGQNQYNRFISLPYDANPDLINDVRQYLSDYCEVLNNELDYPKKYPFIYLDNGAYTYTVVRGQFFDDINNETLTLDGNNAFPHATDNMDGTYTVTPPASGTLTYTNTSSTYPDVSFSLSVAATVQFVSPPTIIITGNNYSVTQGSWANADTIDTVVTLNGVSVPMTGTLTISDDGKTLQASETASNILGTSSPAVVSEVYSYYPPPSNTSLPSISIIGNDWTVTQGSWNDADNITTTVTIDGVSVGMSGTTTASDDGKTLLVSETATNIVGTSGPVNTSTTVTYSPPPSNVSAPYITVVGNSWSVTQGSWNDADNITTTVTIDGVSVGLSGTTTASDDGKTLLVSETATNIVGTSGPVNASSVVTYYPPPSNTSLPTIEFVGNNWTVTQGSWNDADNITTTVTIDGVPVGMSGTVTVSDDGKTLQVSETATNIVGTSGPVNASSVVTYYPPPSNISAPYITVVGNSWSVTQGVWNDADNITTTVTIDGVPVGMSGTTSASDNGKTLLVSETASNSIGTSSPVVVSEILNYFQPPVNVTPPSISIVDNVWTVTQGTWNYQDSITTTVTLDGSPVGMTGVVGDSDTGLVLEVSETATNSDGTVGPLTDSETLAYELTGISSGLTLSHIFAPHASDIDTNLDKTLDGVFSAEFTGFGAGGGDGIIFEAGGSSRGAAVFIRGSDLVVRAGHGGPEWPGSGCSYLVVPRPMGDGILTWQIAGGKVRAWWNNNELGLCTGSYSGNWAGSNASAFMDTSGATVNGAPASGYTDYATVSNLRYCKNQTVLVPTLVSYPYVTWSGNDYTVVSGIYNNAVSTSATVTIDGITYGPTGAITISQDGENLTINETATNSYATIGIPSSTSVIDYLAPHSASMMIRFDLFDPSTMTIDGSNNVSFAANQGNGGSTYDMTASTYYPVWNSSVTGIKFAAGVNDYMTFANYPDLANTHIIFGLIPAPREANSNRGNLRGYGFAGLYATDHSNDSYSWSYGLSGGGSQQNISGAAARRGEWSLGEYRIDGTGLVTTYWNGNIIGPQLQLSHIQRLFRGLCDMGGNATYGFLCGVQCDPNYDENNLEPAVLAAREYALYKIGFTLP